MLQVAGYTIDRIVRVDEDDTKATLGLVSGIECSIPKRDIKAINLIEWAKDMCGFNKPMALRIVDGVATEAALELYTSVMALSPKGVRPIKVNLLGKSGTYYFTSPELADECYPLLAHSLATGLKLLIFHGYGLEAAVELSLEQIENLKVMSSHPSSFEHPLAHLFATR